MNFEPLAMVRVLPGIVIGLTVHELAHAYSAYRLGDNTAKEEGRITLNPLKHIDPLGFIMLIFVGFGWAKPVSFNPANLKNRHKDEIIISLAGPLSNLILAFLFFLLARILYFNSADPTHGEAILKSVNLFILWGTINISLFVFNLIPIPPLDGSHLYTPFLARKNPDAYLFIHRWGAFILFGLILIQNNSEIQIFPISPIIKGVSSGFLRVLGF